MYSKVGVAMTIITVLRDVSWVASDCSLHLCLAAAEMPLPSGGCELGRNVEWGT